MVAAKDFDHPIVFLFTVTIGVVAMLALGRLLFAKLGWTGPLGLFTMGTQG
jgi:hypothetical protein